jgi:glycosyltransferase involved in cell wall biosynthesis
MHDGETCEKCLGRLPWRGVVNACYRNSIFYSAGIALMEGVHRLMKTWVSKIDAYIALTEFSRQKFVECGLPQEKIFVKPNFLTDPPEALYDNRGYGVFIGRLSVEKGLKILLDAVKALNSTNNSFHLKIIGTGPLEAELERVVKSENIPNLEIAGRQSFNVCMDSLQKSAFLILPSVCYEGFPMTVSESYACGKPVIASGLGAMAELIDDTKTGLLFESGNSSDLAEKMKWMIDNRNDCIAMGKNARKVFEEKYTAEKNFEILMNIYQKVLHR